MEYDNKLQEEVIKYFKGREDFYFHGRTSTHFFKTWEKGKEKHIVQSKKPHGGKDGISASVNVYTEKEKYGVELKIEMYMWGYQSEETVFQGWVESISELEVICKAVGL